MSTSAPISPSVSQDEFQALEQKVLRAVEIVRHEREARAAADAKVAHLRQQLAEREVRRQVRVQVADAGAGLALKFEDHLGREGERLFAITKIRGVLHYAVSCGCWRSAGPVVFVVV